MFPVLLRRLGKKNGKLPAETLGVHGRDTKGDHNPTRVHTKAAGVRFPDEFTKIVFIESSDLGIAGCRIFSCTCAAEVERELELHQLLRTA